MHRLTILFHMPPPLVEKIKCTMKKNVGEDVGIEEVTTPLSRWFRTVECRSFIYEKNTDERTIEEGGKSEALACIWI